MASIVTVVALAFVAESLVEYFAAEWVGRWAKYVAAGVGVLMALNFGLDIFGEFLGLESRVPYAGMVLSGLLLGRGANFVNDFGDRFLRRESGEQRRASQGILQSQVTPGQSR